jgi:hypothetical protein
MASENHPNRLEFEIGTGTSVDLAQLVTAATEFSAAVREVARAYTGVSNAVRWIVEVHPGCVTLPLMPEVVSEKVSPSAAAELPELIAGGLDLLQREAVRPDYFTDRALEKFRDVAKFAKDDFPIGVRNGHGRIPLGTQLVHHVELILGKPRYSVGTIEGRLESVTIHGNSEFTIWPTGRTGVKCSFGQLLSLENDVAPALGKRVSARGRIKSKPDGTREGLQVHSLRVLNRNPVEPDEVRGILRGYEEADW